MRHLLLIPCLLASVFSGTASALITGGKNEPLSIQGLPEGAIELANLQSRVAWWEGPPFGGGQYHFDYVGETDDLQSAIDLFAKLDSDRKRLIVRSGRSNSFWLDTTDASKEHPVDWQFIVWVPQNWQRLRDAQAGLLTPGDEGDSPKTELLVFVSDRIAWSSLRIPAGLTVVEERFELSGLAPELGAAVRGRVVNLAGKPIDGATVSVGQDDAKRTGTSDTSGEFLITKIAAGTHRILVSAQGYATKDVYYHTFQPSLYRRLDDVTLAESASPRVRIVDDKDRPLAGIEIRVSSCRDRHGQFYRVPGHTGLTSDENGEFVLRDIPDGKLKFISASQDYYYNSVLNEHDTTETPITLKLLPTGSLTVLVRDASGQPVTSKYIVEITRADAHESQKASIGSWGGSGHVDPQGKRAFLQIPPGDYVVTGRPNPGRSSDRTDPVSVQIKSNDAQQIKLIAR